MKWHNPTTVFLLMGMAFLCGSVFPIGSWLAGWLAPATLAAQGRGPVNPPPAPEPTDPVAAPTEAGGPPIVYTQESGQSSAGNGFLAVTGSYGVGTSVLYLIDTVNRQLAVYEARGGSTEQRRIIFVGARKIDLDLQLEKYNDRSEYPYRRLKSMFEKRGNRDPDVSTGLERGR